MVNGEFIKIENLAPWEQDFFISFKNSPVLLFR